MARKSTNRDNGKAKTCKVVAKDDNDSGRSKMATLIDFHYRCKLKMVANDIVRAKATCPWCKTKDSVQLTRATSNNHVHMACMNKDCNMMVME